MNVQVILLVLYLSQIDTEDVLYLIVQDIYLLRLAEARFLDDLLRLFGLIPHERRWLAIFVLVILNRSGSLFNTADELFL